MESQLEHARGRDERAQAHFQLALFHDNNSREPQAIPHYKKALRLGLCGETRAQVLAWLASSLAKTGNPRAAQSRIAPAMRISADPRLRDFLVRLRRKTLRHANEL